ncbi:MAG: CoA transferase [Anaerolineae bacterium]|nr:CoA transferase [Anaerolineae bacterium]
MYALNDIRIIDLSRVLAGPYCTQLLADFGADVIKIEQPGSGDGTRQWGPPWIGDQSAYFLSTNRNKRSVTLDLKSPTGRSVLLQLVDSADIVIENFKVGVVDKLGIDYVTLSTRNPRLIYCSISGYGQTGPYRDMPGYDAVIQAQGGLMSITGPADGDPHKVGVAIADITAGLFAANAIMVAIHERIRSGKGQFIDMALFDTQLAWLVNVAHSWFATGSTPQRHGNAHANIVPYQTFATQDGYVTIGIGTDGQYRRFCLAAGHPELWDELRWQTNEGRVRNREVLVPRLEALFRERPTAAWLDLFAAHNIPGGPINDIPTALSDPQAQARGMVQKAQHPTLGSIDLLGPVAKLSRTPAAIRSAPPLLGQHTAEVLGELGYSAETIAAWREQGVI